ncbi:MAG: LpqB family beta-propeller domain-containing protein [Nocardioides sp.]
MRRRPLALVWTTIAAAVLSGCVSLPESGPVFDAGSAGSSTDRVACCYLPNGPQPGESQTDIVQHFLEAMTATPIQTSVARQFLTAPAEASWDPELETIVYDDASQPKDEDRVEVSVSLTDGYTLDSRGVFAGRLPEVQRTLSFGMDFEAGQWRIAELRDALIVPRSWTDDHFQSVDVYYVDPTAGILVPEPVSVPRGEQFATALTRSLLSGPGPSLRQVSRNFLPPGLTLGLSDPVGADGVADVALQGDASGMSPQEAELAAVQLAWTLRQDPAIRSLRLTADGEALPGLAREIGVDEGAEYDPASFSSSTAIFALRDGRVVSGPPDSMTPVDGLVGQRDYGFRDIGLNLDSTRVAGVSGGGTTVLEGPTYDPDGSVVDVVSGAVDLLPPAWDFADRMWLVDRTPAGAQVILRANGRNRLVDVPGISAERVRRFLISRDGSRLLAVIRRSRGDILVASRIRYDDRGVMRAALPARQLPWPIEERPRILDIGWQTPTSVAVLYPIRDLAQVRTLAVDGSPATLTVASPTLAGDYRWLVGNPEPGVDLFAATPQGVTDLSEIERSTVASDVDLSTLTYTG